MQFVLIFLLICAAFFLCTLGKGYGTLAVLALTLTLIVCCIKSALDHLSSIERKLDLLIDALSAHPSAPTEKEEKQEHE